MMYLSASSGVAQPSPAPLVTKMYVGGAEDGRQGTSMLLAILLLPNLTKKRNATASITNCLLDPGPPQAILSRPSNFDTPFMNASRQT
jgi:hypothetical protein